MSNANTPRIDLSTFLGAQRRERYPVAVVHGIPLSGKTAFARKLAQHDGFGYLDVLAEIGNRPQFANYIDSFDVSALKILILEYASTTAANILLIDELDFLTHIWGGDLKPFQEMVRHLQHPERHIAFCFFLQTRPALEQWKLINAARINCVLPFDSLKPV